MTLFIVVFGGLMAVVLDLFVFGGIDYIVPRKPPLAAPQVEVVEDAPHYVPVEDYLGLDIAPDLYGPFIGDFASELILPSLPEAGELGDDSVVVEAAGEVVSSDVSEEKEAQPDQPVAEPQKLKQSQRWRIIPSVPAGDENWRRYAVPFPLGEGDEYKPRVVIIIDDLGLNVRNSKRVVGLPAPLTLAYLPYANGLQGQVDEAREAGHELIIHTPMEPMNGKTDPGPGALLSSMSDTAREAAFEKMLDSFEGYIGINNHMGSRLTQDEDAMIQIMEMLRVRGLVFVDSKTSPQSVAADVAREMGLYYAERDVFLDHEETPEFVARALLQLENIARRKGIAIAIGHPKEVTIAALEAWIPTLEQKGLLLAPVSAVLSHE